MADHCIRQATSADFDDVMKIGEVRQGTDYLWYRYHSFMDDPNATSYVYLIGKEVVGFCSVFLLDDRQTFYVRDGRAKEAYRGQGVYRQPLRIVGFCSVFLLDDGQTYHGRAGRVKEEYRGHGIYGQLTRQVLEKFRTVTTLKHDSLMVENVNFEAMKDRLLKTYTEVHRQSIQYFNLKISEDKCFKMETHPALHEVSSTEITSLLTSKAFCGEFFRTDRIIIDGVPLRLVPSNMKYIIGQENLVLASKPEDGRITLISFGTPIPGPLRMLYVIDIFGCDVTILRQHIVRHINYAQSVRQTDIILLLHAPFEDVVITAIADTMESFDIPKKDIPFTTLIHLEKRFKPM